MLTGPRSFILGSPPVVGSSSLQQTTNSLPTPSSPAGQTPSLDIDMSDTFFVTPANELEKLEDWKTPLAYQAAHHHESFNLADAIEVEWRLRDRVGNETNEFSRWICFSWRISDENSECSTCYVPSYRCRSPGCSQDQSMFQVGMLDR